MSNQNLATKIRDLRTRKGLSQEQLSETSKLSLRTVQRIENGESVPRGDTLIRLTQALGVTPDDILEWTNVEDKGYLTLLNLSAISFVLHPILGILIPLVMWILKRDKINLVDDTGKKLISFQITWTLFLYSSFLINSSGTYIMFNFNILESFFAIIYDLSPIGIVVLFLSGYNITLIILNLRRNQKGEKSRYFPAIPFLR